MAKYELAQAQFDAVMSESCPDTPRRRAFLPATEKSRLGYADFAERWTLWLMQNAPDALPRMADTRGYVRLPTEEEWERAARGTDGRNYPWGNDSRPAAANLGADYDDKGQGGRTDGFNFWAPVDKLPLDVTPEGIVGLAGNVEEWTGSLATHPDYPDLQVPIARGGSFALASPDDTLLSSRTFAQSPKDANYARGFRTVRDSEPPAEMLVKAAGP
jgi:formylglycine-generating enzyme required for sulfatase activity